MNPKKLNLHAKLWGSRGGVRRGSLVDFALHPGTARRHENALLVALVRQGAVEVRQGGWSTKAVV